MGLDSFKSDDSNSDSSKSGSSSSSSGKVKIGTERGADTTKPNAPSPAHQSFRHDGSVCPRDIKYRIKCACSTYMKQFSTSRSSDGEIVIYTAGKHNSINSKTVAVFTTIRAFDEDPPFEDELDIKVVPWHLEKKEPIAEAKTISPEGEWKQELSNLVQRAKDHLENEVTE